MILITFPGICYKELQLSSTVMTANINQSYLLTLKEPVKETNLSVTRLRTPDISDFYARIRNLLVLLLADKIVLDELSQRNDQFVVVLPHESELEIYLNSYVHFCKGNLYNEDYINSITEDWYELVTEIKEKYIYFELPVSGQLIDSMEEIYKLYDYTLIS